VVKTEAASILLGFKYGRHQGAAGSMAIDRRFNVTKDTEYLSQIERRAATAVSAVFKNFKCPMATSGSFNRRCPFAISVLSKLR
jgi:hypothetical protein